MRLSLLLSAVYLVTKVVAGGYQGALERVLIYYAYQIDGLNHPDVRRLGFKCASWQGKECKDDVWQEYKCSAFDDPNKPGGKRCNFWELMKGLGETHGGNNAKLVMPQGTDINAKTLPIEKTAVSYYMYTRKYMSKTENGVFKVGSIGDYFPYKLLKNGGTDYNEYLDELGDIVRQTARSKKNNSNKWMFEQFELTLKQLRAARIGDNGRYAVDAYKNNPNMDEKHMVTESPGINPATKDEYKNLDWYENHRHEWFEFKWAETQDKMERDGVQNAGDKLGAFRDEFSGTQTAKDHQAVMDDFELMESKVQGCK